MNAVKRSILKYMAVYFRRNSNAYACVFLYIYLAMLLSVDVHTVLFDMVERWNGEMRGVLCVPSDPAEPGPAVVPIGAASLFVHKLLPVTLSLFLSSLVLEEWMAVSRNTATRKRPIPGKSNSAQFMLPLRKKVDCCVSLWVNSKYSDQQFSGAIVSWAKCDICCSAYWRNIQSWTCLST